jgi:hypothetical protein
MNNLARSIVLFLLGLVPVMNLIGQEGMTSAEPVFTGEKSDWHGYDRYDYVLDSSGGTIAPFARPADEKSGVREPAPGQRRCIIIVPKKFAPGHPWSWRGCYWDYAPQVEVELLRRGFCVAYISAGATLRPDKEWEVWYEYLIGKGMSSRPAFVGMSRGGEFAYVWATTHPDKVSCIYADNPGMNRETLEKFDGLAAADVPLLHVCGSIDPLYGENTLAIESLYQHLGGRISLIIKEGYGHHPHGLHDTGPIADFIERSSARPAVVVPPAVVGAKFKRTNYYGLSENYGYDPAEKVYITHRGPLFTSCYNRYLFNIDGIAGAVVVTVPEKEASGKPWVFRAGYAGRDAVVDLGLLARGYTIVTGPVSYNSDSLSLKDWNTTYQLMVDHGYAAKPVLEGAGGAAGEIYGWAINNPGKVSCIYAENPLFRSSFSVLQPLDGLPALAKAGVRLLDVCGSADPGLAENALASEATYKALGGQVSVIVAQGEGHYPLGPKDAGEVVKFIAPNER